MSGTNDGTPYAAQNERFRHDVQTFGLCYRCRDCAHLAPVAERCSLGYPRLRLGEAQGPEIGIEATGEYVFCKYFELV